MSEPTTAYEPEVIDLKAIIRRAWEVADYDDFKQSLVNESELLAERILQIGDAAETEWNENQDFKAGIATFIWAEKMKAFLILWRDVLFQAQKAQILVLDAQSEASLLEQLKAASHTALFKAAEQLASFWTTTIQEINRTSGGSVKQLEQWQLQNNPWQIYREQIQQLSIQCQELQQKHIGLKDALRIFHYLYARIREHCTTCEEQVRNFKAVGAAAIPFIEEHINERPGKVASYLEDLEKEMDTPNYLDDFLNDYESQVAQLPAGQSIPVAVEEGKLKVKEFNFRRAARAWLESEVLPLLYETWELTENANNGIRMALVNVRNRVLIIVNEAKEGKTVELSSEAAYQPLKTYLQGFESYEDSLRSLRQTITERLADHFKVAGVYKPAHPFLPLPFQSTINQLRVGQNELLGSINRRFRQLSDRIRNAIDSVEQEESLSHSEKIARFIQSRSQSKVDNNQYSSIFLTKGYIGESFWVGREQELQHIATLIAQWELGFRGAVCLTGQRFSGKTVFGEQVAHRHFPEHTIRLQPNAVVHVEGRKMNTTHKLGEALNFIRKHTLNKRSLVWIDDLELWEDINTPLGENIEVLKKQIDAYSSQLFFMVSMSNWMYMHLQRTNELQKVFQAEINLDHMSLKEVRQAILIRHGATHKVLVDEAGEEVTPQQFNRMTARLYRMADGIMGEALNLWSLTTRNRGTEQVYQSLEHHYHLPDFIHSDNAILLMAIMMEKRTNEYRLRKLFGPAFTDKYRSIMQRLFSAGLLVRHIDGWVEINEVAANEIGRLLQRKNYIKFYH